MIPEVNLEEIAQLVREQLPERRDVIAALQNCGQGSWSGPAYYRFVDPTNANKSGAAWQYEESITITSARYGELVLDVLKGPQIGGIEFIDLIE